MAVYKSAGVVFWLTVGMLATGTQLGMAQEDEPASAPIADAPAAVADDETGKDDGENEVIQERFPNTLVKIERYVTRDAEGNYVNHGPYTQWDERGQLVAKGQFKFGKRHGKWLHWFAAGQGPMFTGAAYEGFERPFLSEVNYDEGIVDGLWMVIDAKNRKITDWAFERDIQEGPAIWYFPNGQKRRDVTYHNGQMEGELLEWTHDNKLAVKEIYLDGRKLGIETDTFSPGHKKSERGYSYAVPKITYNAMEGAIYSTPVDKKTEKLAHGHSAWWYSNGQKQSEGNFRLGVPNGTFVWWHPNGQKQAQGEYADGKQSGRWVWWHANGQRQVQGQYTTGQQVGTWSSWKENGHLNTVENFSNHPSGEQADKQPTENPEIGSKPALLPTLRK